jgi:hypothetical protein
VNVFVFLSRCSACSSPGGLLGEARACSGRRARSCRRILVVTAERWRAEELFHDGPGHAVDERHWAAVCLMNAILKQVSTSSSPRWSAGCAIPGRAGDAAGGDAGLRALAEPAWAAAVAGVFHSGGLILWFGPVADFLAEMTAIGQRADFHLPGAVLILGAHECRALGGRVGGFAGVLLIVRPWKAVSSAISMGTLLLLAVPIFPRASGRQGADQI